MIQFDKVCKHFSQDFILNNFCYEVAKGDKVLITGRSGIGKTTLFRLILGFETPDSGTISFDNEVINEKTVWNVRRKIAYVGQETTIGQGKVENFFKETLSLKSNIPIKSTALHNVDELFALFYLTKDMLQKNIEDLSGGERQRVAIINAILLQRKVFLLDEFTSALDSELKNIVATYFFNQPEYTVMAISHDTLNLECCKNVRHLKLDSL
ncbi:MAG: ATP-binding cassette domain-containing protein [Paludibacter sp.]|nr:ATP-binding cassette domain-containing protein [Paludibacter sp.]